MELNGWNGGKIIEQSDKGTEEPVLHILPHKRILAYNFYFYAFNIADRSQLIERDYWDWVCLRERA